MRFDCAGARDEEGSARVGQEALRWGLAYILFGSILEYRTEIVIPCYNHTTARQLKT